jgi:hypothetical protein
MGEEFQSVPSYTPSCLVQLRTCSCPKFSRRSTDSLENPTLHIVHERFGSRSDPGIHGHLHYPNDLNGPLNETTRNKIRQYHTDYNNLPINTNSFMTVIVSTSGCLHSEFVCLYFYNHIGKLIAFLQLQEFRFFNLPVSFITPTLIYKYSM